MSRIIIGSDPSVLRQNQMAFDRAGLNIGGPVARYRERSRYASRYGDRYGDRYGVGAGASPYCFDESTGQIVGQGQLDGVRPPPGAVNVVTDASGQRMAHINFGGDNRGTLPTCNGPGATRTPASNAGHGRRTYEEHNYSCEIKPPKCECHVIGGNTLNDPDLATGVPSTTFATVTLDSGDASFFVPYYISILAFETGAVANLAVTGIPRPVLLQDARSGREPNLRRASDTDRSFGIITTVYGQEKEIECVDWTRFASVNNQQLTMVINNPNTVSIHVFVVVWGLAAA